MGNLPTVEHPNPDNLPGLLLGSAKARRSRHFVARIAGSFQHRCAERRLRCADDIDAHLFQDRASPDAPNQMPERPGGNPKTR
jgi:hypothetical protein